MSDLIDRQAAIDALDSGAELLRRVLDITDIVGAEREKYKWGLELIESYISDMKGLPSVEPEQRWILCSEKLPEEEDMYKPPKHRYLCQLRRQDIILVLARLRSVGSPMAAFWDWYGKKVSDTEVIAWMPLPEPYRIPQSETE